MDKHKLWLVIGILIGVVLVGFLVFYAYTPGRQALFGKAITAVELGAVPENQAGIFLLSNTVPAGESFTIPILANVGAAQAGALRFVLRYPAGLTINADCNQVVRSNLGWNAPGLTGIECDRTNRRITFRAGTEDSAFFKSGVFDVATVIFTNATKGNRTLTFTEFYIFALDDFEYVDLIANGQSGVIQVDCAASGCTTGTCDV